MQPKILIIEDDQHIASLYEEVFRAAGLDIEILNTGGEAIERLKEIREGKKEKPNLILLDLILPDMNGIDILKEARGYPETKELKIFALTNYSNPEFVQELKKENINNILIKTEYTLSDLIKIIKEAL